MNKKTGIIISISAIIILGVIVLLTVIFQPFNQKVDLTNEQKESMKIGGEEADKIATEELKDFPILKYIPYTVDGYSEDFSVYTHYEIWPEDIDSDFKIIIRDYTGGNEQVAKDVMKNWGINLANYKIEYKDLSGQYGSVRVSDD